MDRQTDKGRKVPKKNRLKYRIKPLLVPVETLQSLLSPSMIFPLLPSPCPQSGIPPPFVNVIAQSQQDPTRQAQGNLPR